MKSYIGNNCYKLTARINDDYLFNVNKITYDVNTREAVVETPHNTYILDNPSVRLWYGFTGGGYEIIKYSHRDELEAGFIPSGMDASEPLVGPIERGGDFPKIVLEQDARDFDNPFPSIRHNFQDFFKASTVELYEEYKYKGLPHCI